MWNKIEKERMRNRHYSKQFLYCLVCYLPVSSTEQLKFQEQIITLRKNKQTNSEYSQIKHTDEMPALKFEKWAPLAWRKILETIIK